MFRNFFVAILLLSMAGYSVAATDPAVEERIRNSLKVLLPGLVPDSISDTPVPDLFEVVFGTKIVYVTGNGRFLLQGKIIDLETRTELTDDRLLLQDKDGKTKYDWRRVHQKRRPSEKKVPVRK